VCEARACNEGLGAKPLVSGQGGEVPLELTSFQQVRRLFCNEVCNKFAKFVECSKVPGRLHINQIDVDSLLTVKQLLLIGLVCMLTVIW
jgi:hypothetical protein